MSIKSTSTSAAAAGLAILCAAFQCRRVNSRLVLILPITLGLSGWGEKGAGCALARPMPDRLTVAEEPFADRLRRALEDNPFDVSHCR